MGGSQIPDDRNRMELLQAFDATKAGVKGLSDSGIVKLPRIFVRPPEELSKEELLTYGKSSSGEVKVPVIDLDGFQDDTERRKRIVEDVRIASETWGFFQVVNHGIPQSVLDGMIQGIGAFHELQVEAKKKYYTRDRTNNVRYNSSYDLFVAKTASWRDTLTISFSESAGDDGIDRNELPPSCRESTMEYSKYMCILGNVLLGLLSEGLGLETDYLKNMDSLKGHRMHCHYYPPCPEPHLAIGLPKHSDAGFLTILLQNQITSSLQVLYQDQWVDIHPTPGGLVINIGDLLQLVSNGKFKSNEHRAIANGEGPRISVGCFFSGPVGDPNKRYGPIQELTSAESPPLYKEVVFGEYIKKFLSTGLDDYRALDNYKL